jgi:hypothetical protein
MMVIVVFAVVMVVRMVVIMLVMQLFGWLLWHGKARAKLPRFDV